MADADRNVAAEVLAAYRNWKENGESLKARAQGCLVDRFHELIREAQQVQQDLWDDFGQAVKFPTNPKPAKRGKTRPPVRKTASVARPDAAVPVSAVKPTVSKESARSESIRTAPTRTAPLRAAAAPVEVAAPMAARPQPVRLDAARPETGRPETGRSASAKRSAGNAANDIETQRRELTKKLHKAEARLKAAREAGDAAKIQNAEDRVYEINDDLSLLDG